MRPYCLSSSAARSSASGCLRNSSQTAGAPAGSGPADGARSKSPLQVTERSPRMLSVSSAFSWPAFGMPTRMPHCCCTVGIRQRRLHPAELERQPGVLAEVREDVETGTVWVGNVDRRAGAHRARRRRDRLAVGRDQRGAGAVVGLRALDVGLHHLPAGGLAGLDRLLDVGDRGFLDLERGLRMRPGRGASRAAVTARARPSSARRRFVESCHHDGPLATSGSRVGADGSGGVLAGGRRWLVACS